MGIWFSNTHFGGCHGASNGDIININPLSLSKHLCITSKKSSWGSWISAMINHHHGLHLRDHIWSYWGYLSGPPCQDMAKHWVCKQYIGWWCSPSLLNVNSRNKPCFLIMGETLFLIPTSHLFGLPSIHKQKGYKCWSWFDTLQLRYLILALSSRMLFQCSSWPQASTTREALRRSWTLGFNKRRTLAQTSKLCLKHRIQKLDPLLQMFYRCHMSSLWRVESLKPYAKVVTTASIRHLSTFDWNVTIPSWR